MLRYGILFAVMGSLSGCGGPSLSKNQRAEVETIAEDFAEGAKDSADTSDLEERIAELERQAKLWDKSHELHFKNIGQLSKDGVTDANNIAKLSDRMMEHERIYHGVR